MFFDNYDENTDDIIFTLSEAKGEEGVESKSVKRYIDLISKGGMEKAIKDIEQEVKDISTPEQKLAVARKIDPLVQKLTALRHNRGVLRKYVEKSMNVLGKILGANPEKEINLRLREYIRRLSVARDKLLKKKFDTNDKGQKED